MTPLLLAAAFAAAIQSQAPQPPSGLTFNATLGSVRIASRPGDVHTRQFQLSTTANQPRAQFRAHFEDWWRSEDGRESFYAPAGTLRQSCSPWATVNPVEAAVEPGGTLVVRYTLAVPRDIPPGGYWCALTVDQVPDPAFAGPGVGVQFMASISTGVFLDVGDVTRAAEITEVSVADEAIAVRMQNTGNTPVPVEGRVEFIPRGSKEPLATVSIPRGTLLPERVTSAFFGSALPPPADLPDGSYLVRAIMDIGLDHYIGAEREAVVTRGAASSGNGR